MNPLIWILLYVLAGVVFFFVAAYMSPRQRGVRPWDGWDTTEWIISAGLSMLWPVTLLAIAWTRNHNPADKLAMLLGVGILALAAVAGRPGLAQAQARAVASAQVGCPALFYGGKAPAAVGAAPAHLDLCFPAYALSEAVAWREPLWSAEHLTAAQLPPRGADRKNPFHAEAALPPSARSELSDWQACSKTHDRGHATPVGDFADPAARDATFTLANMMAQTKTLNEQTWNHIETGVRAAVAAQGEAWAVTGPHVTPRVPNQCGRVVEPDATWKAVFFPRTGVAGAYWAVNGTAKTYETISVAELIRRVGVDPFPALPAAKKAEADQLPAPIAGGGS